MSLDFERVKAVFQAAVDEYPPDQWDSYLDSACGGDADLRREVNALLRAHQEGGSLLDGPEFVANGTDTIASLAERPGTIIGPYKLLQQIGEGGMGVVFMAEQAEPIQRSVALKIIRPGMDSRQVIARFEAERQALAMMDHANIARVLDAGTTTTGRPYFVMDLVKGLPITEYCDAQNLTIQRRLELMTAVCQAVQHAHQKGIIHRDIKPSNVLVAEYDGRPVPKIIDFGVAKATAQRLTERTMFTQYGQIVGTFEYMSPEQARFNQLDIDTRSDIYSLGVLLYELLAGSTPLEKERLRSAAFDEILRIIGEEEPPRPSTRLSSSQSLPSISAQRQIEPAKLTKLVRGELDWIVMKCLEKDRNRRYETAGGLAMDLQRYLQDETVLACPPTKWYRFRKFVRKNKLVLATIAAVALSLIVGTGVSIWQAARAIRAQHLADERLTDLEQASTATAKALADTKEAQARTEQALAEAKEQQSQAEAITNYLLAAFRKPDPERDGRELKVIDLLKQAETELDTDFSGSARTKGKLLESIGNTYLNLGLPELGAPVLEKARNAFETALGADHVDTLSCVSNLGLAYRLMGRLDEAIQLTENALRSMKDKLGADNLDTILCMSKLADVYLDAGRTGEAVKLGEEVLRLRRAKLGPDVHETLLSMSNLAQTYQAAGRWPEALPMFEEVLKLRKAKSGPDHPATLMCMNNLAVAYRAMGRLKEAESLSEKALAVSRTKFGPDHLNTFVCMSNLATIYATESRFDDAIPLIKELLNRRTAKLGPDHPATLMAMNNLAMTYRAAGRVDKALPLLQEVLKLMRAKLGLNHPHAIMATNNLASALADVGRVPEAVPLFEEAFKRSKETLGTDHPDTLFFMNNLSDAYRQTQRLDAAISLAEEALKLQRTKLGPDHPDTLTTMNNLAGAYHEASRTAEALPLIEEALKLRSAKLGPNHPDTLRTMNNLAGFLESAGDLDRAIPLFEKTLAAARSKLGTDHPDTHRYIENLARCYEKKGRYASAEPLIVELVELKKKTAGQAAPAVAKNFRWLGRNLLKQQKFEPAEQRLRESLAIGETTLPDDWSTFSTKSLLGGSLAGQKKYVDAEPLLLDGYQGMKQREAKIPKGDQAELVEALDRLIEFYQQTGKPDEAAKWRKN